MPDVLVIYSEATRRIRRVVSPAPKDPSIHVGKGEAAMTHAVGKTGILIPQLQDEVVKQHGPVLEDRYAIVAPDGKVLDVVIMDPVADDHLIYERKGLQVVKTATATKRATFDANAKTFIEPAETQEERDLRLATEAKEAPVKAR